jgi:class 3 adenylate cyclase/predicted ATPase
VICSNCGTENAAGQRFCDECGAGLAVACSNCGEPNRSQARFCGNCGTTLSGEPDAQSPTAVQPTRRPSVAERRLVSVVFVDLVGFTPFAEERDAEAVREVLDRYFGIARLAIERHGGTIEKFIGDAVMAVWGTPIAHEDDAERAVRAVLELVDGVRSLGPGIDARAGIVTGEAAVTVGAEGQGMVAGDLVNTASRLQSVAPPGAVLVSETTMHAAQAAISFEAMAPQELKGKAAPVAAFRAQRVVAQRGGQGRSESLEAPFVGRDEEFRQLKELLHATTRDRRVRLASLIGPAGIGKSRLAWELEKYVDGVVETVYWHRGRSPAYGEGITFWALGEMIRRRAQLAENDDEETTRARLAETVAQFVADAEERAWVESALLTLLGLESAPAGGRDALFAAWRIFFERIAARETTVLVFEDLQWADGGLLDFIEHLLEWSKNLPLLVITLSRPELYDRRPGWGSGHRFMTALTLEPLSEQAMRELLGGLVPGLPESTIEGILRRADGIPLYAVEMVRMLVSEGRLERSNGAFKVIGDVGQLAVPETLRSLIASRLDGLEPADRGLVQDASVLGQRFSLPALSAVSGEPVDGLEPRLRILVRREFLDLVIDPRSPERGQYGFVQSLIREVAYGTLARRDRRTRHLAAARYFEGLGDDELAGALATHYLAAHQASTEGPEADAVAVQARLALRSAAERAASLGAHDQAVTYAVQAMAVTSEPSERAALLELAADSANASARDDRAESYAREAIEIHAAVDDDRAVLKTSALLGRILIDHGRFADAIEAMEWALERRDRGVDDDASAALLATLSRAFMRSDEPARSIEIAERALALAERQNLDLAVAEALNNKGSSLSRLGRRREAQALHEMAIRLAEKGGWIDLELRIRNNLSVALMSDEPLRSLDIVQRGVELSRKVGQRGMLNWLSGTVAMYAYTIGSDWEAALTGLEETLAGGAPEYDRARALAIRALFHATMGRDAERAIADAAAAAEKISELQIDATVAYATAMSGFLEGRYDDAFVQTSRTAELWNDFAHHVFPIAARAALFDGHADRAREVARRLEEYPRSAALEKAAQASVAAALAAADGNKAEALRLYRAAVDLSRRIGIRFRAAEAIVDAAMRLPGEPEVAQWVPEARATFEELGAVPYIALLDRAMKQPKTEPPDATAAVTTATQAARSASA